MPTFAKPPTARQVEARARAKTLHVRVAVVSHARAYATKSATTGETYRIERTRDGWRCSCLGYDHTGMCKHLGQVERRAEREGWDFGRICPLALAERHGPAIGTVRVVGGHLDHPAPAPFVPRIIEGPKPPAVRAALAGLYGDDDAA